MFLDVDEVVYSVYADGGKNLELYGFDPRGIDCVDLGAMLKAAGIRRNRAVDCLWVEVYRRDDYSGEIENVKGYGKPSELNTYLSLKVESWIGDQNPEFRDGLVIFPKNGYECIKDLNDLEIHILLWRGVKHEGINDPDCLISIYAEPLLGLPQDYETRYHILNSLLTNSNEKSNNRKKLSSAFYPVSLVQIEKMVMAGAEAPESLKMDKPVGDVDDSSAFGFVTDTLETVCFRPERLFAQILKEHGDWKAAYLIPTKNGSSCSSLIFCDPQHPKAINIIKKYDIIKKS